MKSTEPFSTIIKMVNRIIEDGVIDEYEKEELKRFFTGFVERKIDDPKIQDEIYGKDFMLNYSQVFKPFTALYDRYCEISFKNRKFCFTGPASTGPRKKLNQMVKAVDGIPVGSVSETLDYLVIGAQSSPCWVYSTYGRKIEKAINYQKAGVPLTILHENDFIRQLENISSH